MSWLLIILIYNIIDSKFNIFLIHVYTYMCIYGLGIFFKGKESWLFIPLKEILREYVLYKNIMKT